MLFSEMSHCHYQSTFLDFVPNHSLDKSREESMKRKIEQSSQKEEEEEEKRTRATSITTDSENRNMIENIYKQISMHT